MLSIVPLYSKCTRALTFENVRDELQSSHAFYQQKVSEARELEMHELKWQRYLTAANTLLGSLLSISVPVSMFSWYTMVQGKVLDASSAFTALAWIAQLVSVCVCVCV